MSARFSMILCVIMMSGCGRTAPSSSTAPVINSLPPMTDANKDLTLSTELLVGRWESQDGAHMPILFAADGTVELGFLRKDGQWLMSKGTYQIQDDQVVTTQHDGETFGRSFNFARGVLYAPRGPSPQVVWRRVGDL
jgi:hypothetical protein